MKTKVFCCPDSNGRNVNHLYVVTTYSRTSTMFAVLFSFAVGAAVGSVAQKYFTRRRNNNESQDIEA